MHREVEIEHPTVPYIDHKGVISSSNSSLFVINDFVLVLPKTVFPPSPIISYALKEMQKSTIDLGHN